MGVGAEPEPSQTWFPRAERIFFTGLPKLLPGALERKLLTDLGTLPGLPMPEWGSTPVMLSPAVCSLAADVQRNGMTRECPRQWRRGAKPTPWWAGQGARSRLISFPRVRCDHASRVRRLAWMRKERGLPPVQNRLMISGPCSGIGYSRGLQRKNSTRGRSPRMALAGWSGTLATHDVWGSWGSTHQPRAVG